MARQDALIFRLRRFRVAMLAALALPWVFDVLLAPFVGWSGSALRNAIFLAVDVLLAVFAWHRPAGIAAILIIVRSVLEAVVLLWLGTAIGRVYGALLGVSALVVLALLVPLWAPLRSERRRVLKERGRGREERSRARLARLDASASTPDRRAMQRRDTIEERGYL